MICSHCSSENRDGAKFCNECGRPLLPEVVEVKQPAFLDSLVDDSQVTKELEAISQDDLADRLAARGGDAGSVESEPLRKVDLPAIDVVGVNVDEAGNRYEDSYDEALFAEDVVMDESSDEPRDDDRLKGDGVDAFEAERMQPATGSGGSAANLEGFDEVLVDAGYVPPKAQWRSGDTMEMPKIEGADPAPKRDFRAPDMNEKKGLFGKKKEKRPKPERSGKGKAVIAVVLCLAVVAAAAAGLTYRLEMWGGKTIPDVTGMTQADATFLLESKGFTVRETQVKSDETEGLVLLVDPGAGSRVGAGSEIVIHVSQSRTVPDVMGKQRDEAMALLQQDGFENVTVEVQKSDDQEGLVVGLTPEAGTKAKAVAEIVITVTEAYRVPDIEGMGWDDAVAALKGETYKAAVEYVLDESLPPNTIMGSKPAAGEKLASGSTVTILITKSRGTELEEITASYLQGAGTIAINGTTYQIDSVDAVSFQGDETVAFTITGRAVGQLAGETVVGSTRQFKGTLVWDADNNVVGASISG